MSHWIYITIWERCYFTDVFNPSPSTIHEDSFWSGKDLRNVWELEGPVEELSPLPCFYWHCMLSLVSVSSITTQSSLILWGTTLDDRRLLCSTLKASFLWVVLDSMGRGGKSHRNSLGILLISITECVCNCDLLQAISWHKENIYFSWHTHTKKKLGEHYFII